MFSDLSALRKSLGESGRFDVAGVGPGSLLGVRSLT